MPDGPLVTVGGSLREDPGVALHEDPGKYEAPPAGGECDYNPLEFVMPVVPIAVVTPSMGSSSYMDYDSGRLSSSYDSFGEHSLENAACPDWSEEVAHEPAQTRAGDGER